MTLRSRGPLVLGIVALALTAGACADPTASDPPASEPVVDPRDGGVYDATIDPADFVREVDNPYFPLVPGTRWVYEGEDDGEHERIEVVVLDRRREVMGISAVVVRDTVELDGEVVEDTFDWFAQDREGNVWYLGEDSKEIEDGEVINHEGSWEAGVDGALPGIIMLADPQVGDAYRQEFYEGEAEDLGEVLEVNATESVEYGAFEDLLVTEDWNPLEPGTIEHKYYARGIGMVLETKARGGEARIELVEFTPAE